MSKLLQKYPVLKTMAAYLFINTAADINEQTLIKGHTWETYDVGKTVRIGVTGGFVIAPMIHNWVMFIDRFFPGKMAIAVAKKVVSDIILFAPLAISSFYITTNILEMKEDLTEELQQKFFKTWSTGLMFWPIVQTINFKFIPRHYKTSIYMPTASFIWMNYLCFMKDKKVFHIDKHSTEDQSTVQPKVENKSRPI